MNLNVRYAIAAAILVFTLAVAIYGMRAQWIAVGYQRCMDVHTIGRR